MKKLLSALALAAVVAPVWAATQTVTLSVPGMTCSACPITVKKAISKVDGVSKVDVTFETREAVVTFDDAKTSVQKLTKATEDAGLPIISQELIMKDPKTLLRVSIIGTTLVALCCFTPVLVILLGVVGLSALTGYLDYVLLPALAIFIGLTIYAIQRKRQADACCTPKFNGVKK
ncbi:mercury ion transport transmembrane protein MerF [Klebsiella aerogenes]|nr:mercury ion transport transmembrane protein MerF [Klebsiella aerogenes]